MVDPASFVLGMWAGGVVYRLLTVLLMYHEDALSAWRAFLAALVSPGWPVMAIVRILDSSFFHKGRSE